MMTETKLKPCPFCGEGKTIEVSHVEREDRSQCKFKAFVSCLNCFAETTNHGFDWTSEEAEKNAVNAWNRRVDND